MKFFAPIPCGSSLPVNNPHAVSVNLPTIADVISYEENIPEFRQKLESAYPRFVMNRLVEKVYNYVRKANNISDDVELIPVSTEKAFSLVEKTICADFEKVTADNFHFIAVPLNLPKFSNIKSFIQHAGLIPSSRKAEDFLLRNNLITKEFAEEKIPEEKSEQIVKKVLSDAYGYSTPDNVFLCSAGMNAIFSVFDALKDQNTIQGKKIVIQSGWSYLDTMEIVRKFSDESFVYYNPLSLPELEEYIEKNHTSIGAVFTEFPNNPLIQCFDLPRLSAITKKYNIALVIDSTMSTPFTANIFPYADVAVESLTKFACGYGDVLMGAVIINNQSAIACPAEKNIAKTTEKPYTKDICRIAYEIQFYEERVKIISENTFKLVEYLGKSNKIKKISWCLDSVSAENFSKIRKSKDLVPGLISLVFDRDLHNYYDKLRLPKGPSLGTGFTLAMPYIYLAHYDMIKTEKGRRLLRLNDINPELLRISVGSEPIDEIIKVFDEVLQ